MSTLQLWHHLSYSWEGWLALHETMPLYYFFFVNAFLPSLIACFQNWASRVLKHQHESRTSKLTSNNTIKTCITHTTIIPKNNNNIPPHKIKISISCIKYINPSLKSNTTHNDDIPLITLTWIIFYMVVEMYNGKGDCVWGGEGGYW